MVATAVETSKLTDRYQTTVPSGVRKRLNLKKGDRLRYSISDDGRVFIEVDRDTGDDPALGAFLDLLETDIRKNPGHLRAFDGGLKDRLATLVGDVEIDLDAPLSPDDE